MKTQQKVIEWNTPIFIVSAGRSGSTYLTNILNAHPDIVITHESNLAHFFKLTHILASLPAGKPCEIGPFHLSGLISEPYIPLFSNLYLENIRQLWKTFYLEQFQHKSFSRWGDNFQMAVVIPDILREFPSAQFIHLIRDGRDRVVSAKHWYSRSKKIRPYLVDASFKDFCEYWTRINRGILEALQDHPYTLRIHYEHLIQQSKEQVSKILQFLRISEESNVFEYIEHHSLEIFANHGTSSSPQASIGRWKEELSQAEKKLAHEIMKEMLVRLGYEKISNGR